MQEEELWKQVPGFSMYEASTLGRIRSHSAKKRGNLLQTPIDNRGYLHTCLMDDSGNRTHLAVHKVIAMTFLGRKPYGFHTRHLSGNKLDNRVCNLAYGTAADNGRDSRAYNGTIDKEQHGLIARAIYHKLIEMYRSGKGTLKSIGSIVGMSTSAMSRAVSESRDHPAWSKWTIFK